MEAQSGKLVEALQLVETQLCSGEARLFQWKRKKERKKWNRVWERQEQD